jgi:predicted nucleic acid-binding protein
LTAFYADTSVLLKRHITEPGSRWFQEVVDFSDASILTTELSIVEVYSALNRLVREGNLPLDLYQDLTIVLKRLFEFRYESIPISNPIRDIACGVLERHPLRAYDSIHLASALFSNRRLISEGKVGLTFQSSDYRLLAAATAEDLPTFDPTTAP